MESVSVYYRNSKINLEENETCEFKGHISFSFKEIFYKEGKKTSRKHISRVFCGMLNSKKGGTIYIGILDNGYISGIMMSPLQQLHFIAKVLNTLENFFPKVPEFLYEIKFIPVIDQDEKKYKPPSPKLLQSIDKYSHLNHSFTLNKKCFCDLISMAYFSQGYIFPFWVIEIQIKPIDLSDEKIKKFYENSIWVNEKKEFISDDGKSYIRQNVCTILC